MTLTDKESINVLGSGPAGMAAAINLAKAGYKVTVFEQKDKPAFKFNGGWQIIENYTSNDDALEELTKYNIPVNFLAKPESSIDFYDSRLRKFVLKGKKPFGYFIKRGTENDCLDAGLHESAKDAGVTVKFNSKLQTRDADIIAGGYRSATGISKEIVFDSDADDILLTILDNHLAPRGFAYLFIINGRGTIGTAVLSHFRDIDYFAEAVLLRLKQLYKFNMRNTSESVSGVNFFLPKTAIVDNKLYVGEAAGFQDYLFGLNVRRSLQSGYFAAQSIITNTNYDDLWMPKFRDQLSSGIAHRFLYEKLGNYGYTLFLRSIHRLDFQKFGYKLNNPSFIRKAIAYPIQVLWNGKGTCKHDERCIWCRSNK